MHKVLKISLGVSFLIYLFVLTIFLFLSSRGYWVHMPLLEYIQRSSNFVPFKTISIYVMAIIDGSMNIDIPIKNLLGNLILFFPMGIYLPFLIRKMDNIKVFIISISIVILSVEVLQLVTRRGSFDVDDFLLNISGALIGFGMWKMKVVQKLLK
ncbi:VanZ family protein [Sutcliffiella halmapala]|uniref:VanZ family protein n=1 Tax=Sutcliffiella halmapala TaxID=79882 RepID=UPI000994BBE0|nr:VanZ family protein [Sutcliffiella halmapala]